MTFYDRQQQMFAREREQQAEDEKDEFSQVQPVDSAFGCVAACAVTCGQAVGCVCVCGWGVEVCF